LDRASILYKTPMPTPTADSLFARLNESQPLVFAQVSFPGWEPDPQKSHENVDTWCANQPDFQAVRGWIVADTRKRNKRVTFMPHSVVRAADGMLADITLSAGVPPQALSFIAPMTRFLPHDGTAEEFETIKAEIGAQPLQYAEP
jgi:hypothetical protein